MADVAAVGDVLKRKRSEVTVEVVETLFHNGHWWYRLKSLASNRNWWVTESRLRTHYAEDVCQHCGGRGDPKDVAYLRSRSDKHKILDNQCCRCYFR